MVMKSVKAAKRKRAGAEWVGGLASLPAYVSEGVPYRPDVLFWLDEQGAALGHVMGRPGELVGQALQNLQSTIERPLSGPPRSPERVRVASPELAEALRAGPSEIEIVCAPTPEADAFIAAMHEHMANEDEQSYLAYSVAPAAMTAFFRASAEFFRAAPWKVVPSDRCILSVSIEQLGVNNAVLSVMGQLEESPGLVLFSNVEDFAAYADAEVAVARGECPKMPPRFTLSFESEEDLSVALRKEIAEHHWEVAGTRGYPTLTVTDEDLVSRAATPTEVTIAEALALALPRLLEEKELLLAAWSGGEAVARKLSVATHAGATEVSFEVAHEWKSSLYPVPENLAEALIALVQDGEEIDPDARTFLEDALMRRFLTSPEAEALTGVRWCEAVMEYAASFFDETIATLGPKQLEEIIFEIIPRKHMAGASYATPIIEETRALFAFLEREYGLEQADACLRVLDGDAVKDLAAALSDTGGFEEEMSLLKRGREAGFDMSTPEGIQAWMRVVQSQQLSAPVAPRPVDRAAARVKKNARKAARKARRKNR